MIRSDLQQHAMQAVPEAAAAGAAGELMDPGMMMSEHHMMNKERPSAQPYYYGGYGAGAGPGAAGVPRAAPAAMGNHLQQPRAGAAPLSAGRPPAAGVPPRYAGGRMQTPGVGAGYYGGGARPGSAPYSRISSQPERDGPREIIEENKVFIGSLPPGTTKEALTDMMKKFGTVDDAVIMVDRITGASRGFGFVTFSDAAAVNECMQAKPHSIDGHEVDVRRAIPRGQAVSRLDEDQENKIFIGGIPDDLTEEKITNFLAERFGAVKKVSLMRDKATGRPRGFGFVTFLYSHSAQNAVGMHDIEGVIIEAKKAEPREQLREERNRRMGGEDYYDMRGRGIESNGHPYRPMRGNYGYPGPEIDAYGGPAGGPMRRSHFSRPPCGDYGDYGGMPVRHPYPADPYASPHPAAAAALQQQPQAYGAAGPAYGMMQTGVNPYSTVGAVPGSGGAGGGGGGAGTTPGAASMYPPHMYGSPAAGGGVPGGAAAAPGDVVQGPQQAEYGGGAATAGSYGLPHHAYGGAGADYDSAAGGGGDPYDVRNVRRSRGPGAAAGYGRLGGAARVHPYA